MHALALKRLSRKLTLSISVLFLASCGQGDGPASIAGTPATPLPDLPPGYCDPINFEILCAPPTIVNFNGGATTIIDNPDPTGINDSDKVAQMQKYPDEVFGGTKFELDSAIDFGAGEAYTIKVWSPRSVEVLFKLEETGNPGGGFDAVVSHSGGGAWEELCFDFAGQNVPPPVTALTIIFDNGTQGAADTDPNNWTFYYDDIEQVASCPDGGGGGGGGGGSARGLTDFENAGAPYTFSDFDGGIATVVDNPDVSGIDVSARVAQMQKFAGEAWGGTTLDMGGDVDWSAGEVWTMKVRSARVVPVLFKWEGLNEERSVDHAGSGTWEELCFDFTGATGGAAATALTLIFDLGVMGDAAGDPANWTFEFDDITQVASCPGGGGGGGGGGSADIDFEAGGAGAGFTWATFENDDNPALEIIANPVSGGINTSTTVAKTARVGGQPWAGVETAHGDIGPLTLDATNSIVKIMVYKSVISDVGVKFAIGNGGAQPEIKVANTVINQWEELTFDFTGNIGLVESINIDQLISTTSHSLTVPAVAVAAAVAAVVPRY